MYAKLCVYVPEEYLPGVKQALFDAGAGKLGAYEQCCWQTSGVGQFKALEQSSPFLGEPNQLTEVTESKLEMIFNIEHKTKIIAALKAAHPYEMPAFQYWPVAIE